MMSSIIKITVTNSHSLSTTYYMPGTVLCGAYLLKILSGARRSGLFDPILQMEKLRFNRTLSQITKVVNGRAVIYDLFLSP